MNYMETEDIQSVLDRVSYKPGWTFGVMEKDSARYLWCTAKVLDVYNPTIELELSTSQSIRWNIRQDELKKEIYRLIMSMEEHELLEWFRIDGKFFKDPHPK